MGHAERTATAEIPTAARSRLSPGWLAALILLPGPCAFIHTLQAQALLTEAEVIRIARERAPAAAVALHTMRLADAQERTAGLMRNPQLGWQRQALTTGPFSAQDVVTASLRVDVARPLAVRSLAASRSAWMRSVASVARNGALLEALHAYYALVIAARRVELLDRTQANLGEASRVLERRERAGTASGYESARLRIARELAGSRLALAVGSRRAGKARLAGLLGLEASKLQVAASLRVAVLDQPQVLLERALEGRQAVSHARRSRTLARVAEKRAAWTWLPIFSVTAGANMEDMRYGYAAGFALNVPLFDHGQALRAQAEAQRALSNARLEALERTLKAEITAAHAVYEAAKAELERFERVTAKPLQTLLQAAYSGYREGERSLVELLDAQQAQTQAAQRRLELLLAAKRAEAEVRVAAGELP